MAELEHVVKTFSLLEAAEKEQHGSAGAVGTHR